MSLSRRNFIQSFLTALGSSFVPSVFLASCLPEKSDPLVIDYIGSPENYQYYADYFKKIKKVDLVLHSLETSLESDSKAVFLDVELSLKPTYTIMLLEQNKDVISSYPIATSLLEYNLIQEYLVRHKRILGLINPLRFYTAIRSLKGMVMLYHDPLTEVLISCHPEEIVPGHRVDGTAGPAQFLQRMVSYFSDKFPVSVQARKNDSDRIGELLIDYSTFEARIVFDRKQLGWTMDVTGPDFRARSDYTGILSINNEPQPRINSSSLTWDRAMIQNIEDFTQALLIRSEPELSSLDGLASIILNRAVEESVKSGMQVSL